MMWELADAVERLERWEGAALVLSSAEGGAFCAGGHLGEVRASVGEPERGRRMALAFGSVLDRLLALPVVSVAAIRGPALGGGAEIVTATDARVLHREARIQFVHARLGVAPGWGGARRLVAHLGRREALRLLATAAPLAAEEALAVGLADGVTDEDPVDAALRWLEPVRALPPAAVRAVKQQIGAGSLAEEAAAFATVWFGPDHRLALGRLGGRGGG